MSSVDIGILTIREDEFAAIFDRLGTTRIEQRRHRTYTLAEIEHRSGAIYRVGLVRCLEQGPSSGQDTARDLIEDLDPQWIAVVGIAGAFPQSEFSLGDVVVASRLHDFTVGASLETGMEFANQGGPMSKVIQDLIASLGALKLQLNGWETEESIGLPRPTVDLNDNNYFGPDEWRAKTRVPPSFL